MILAAAVLAGLAAGLLRAGFGKRSFRTISVRSPGLVLFAFLPQWVAFYLARMGMGSGLPDQWAPWVLVISQGTLLVFVGLNWKQPGFKLLGAGLLLNFIVIVANGGLMPIRPELVRRLYPGVPESLWQIGERLGNGKDIVLNDAATRFWFLSDRFMLPDWVSYRVAFSLGDVLIALGAFWSMWQLGGPAGNSVPAVEPPAQNVSAL